MRTFIATALVLGAAALGPACTAPANLKDPPVLTVTSPQRSLQQPFAGQLRVTGTALPNADGTPVEKVLVNNVQATLDARGNFEAMIAVEAGATLIHTVARDAAGTTAEDTRAVQAGELRTAGANIESALAASISTEAFARISEAAGPLVEGMDLGAMLKPMQPMIRTGDPADLNEEDCLFARVWIDNVAFSNIDLSLIPKAGGIAFRAQIDNLDVPGRARYAVACVNGSNNLRVTATRVVVAGTLRVTPNGAAGFDTTLVDPQVTLTNLDVQATGSIPGQILDMIDLASRMQGVIAKGAELAMKPLMNAALGGLAGPKSLDVLGKTLTMEMAPADVAFDPAGGLVVLDLRMMIAGAEAAKYVYTPNGSPNLDAGQGFQLGIADDLANELLAEATALKLFDMTMPKPAGAFDALDLAMTLPPMISADPADGSMKVIVGDLMATFTQQGRPVAKAAINARIDLKIASAANGYGVALQLGEPVLHVNTVDDLANTTGLEGADLGKMVEAGLAAEIANISKLLVSIPVPEVVGLQMRDLSVGSDDGYVVIRGRLE